MAGTPVHQYTWYLVSVYRSGRVRVFTAVLARVLLVFAYCFYIHIGAIIALGELLFAHCMSGESGFFKQLLLLLQLLQLVLHAPSSYEIQLDVLKLKSRKKYNIPVHDFMNRMKRKRTDP